MADLASLARLRRCADSDDAFLYDVFVTTWQSEVAALPNQNLAQHVLRIQHIAQERRFASGFPGHERYIVLEAGERAGRLYVDQSGHDVALLDLTLLPAFRGQGLGARVMRDLLTEVGRDDRTVTLRVPRRLSRVTDFYTRLGFRLVSVDDVDNFFDWQPVDVAEVEDSAAVLPVPLVPLARRADGQRAGSSSSHSVP
jgi:GNAT superfamily N-acetyltransferase